MASRLCKPAGWRYPEAMAALQTSAWTHPDSTRRHRQRPARIQNSSCETPEKRPTDSKVRYCKRTTYPLAPAIQCRIQGTLSASDFCFFLAAKCWRLTPNTYAEALATKIEE